MTLTIRLFSAVTIATMTVVSIVRSEAAAVSVQRISEAEKLGFEEIYVSKFSPKSANGRSKIKVKAFGKLTEVFQDLFG